MYVPLIIRLESYLFRGQDKSMRIIQITRHLFRRVILSPTVVSIILVWNSKLTAGAHLN